MLLRQGPLVEAIQAAIALPGLFSPVAQGDRLLVDGGLLNNVPAGVARKLGARRVLAVQRCGQRHYTIPLFRACSGHLRSTAPGRSRPRF